MSTTGAQKQYSQLLESGELFEFYPKMKGEWDKDKKVFTQEYEQNMKIIMDFDVDFEDE